MSLYFLEPKLVAPGEIAMWQSHTYLAWSPTYWFLGLFQQLNGSPALAPSAKRAWIGFAIAFSATAIAYSLSYLRSMRRMVESPDLMPGSRTGGWLPSFGSSFETAVGQFSVRTLLRSRQHRLLLAFYLGIGFAAAVLLPNCPVMRQLSEESADGVSRAAMASTGTFEDAGHCAVMVAALAVLAIVAWRVARASAGTLQFEEAAGATAKSTGIRAAAISGQLAFVAVQPCRLVDTRDASQAAPFGVPAIAGGQVRTYPAPSHPRCGIPNTALAYSVNFTVVPQGVLSYLSAWPTPNRPVPEVSVLNSLNGQVVANAAVIPAGTNGAIDVFVTNTTDVIIDIKVYYVAITGGGAGGGTVGPAGPIGPVGPAGAIGPQGPKGDSETNISVLGNNANAGNVVITPASGHVAPGATFTLAANFIARPVTGCSGCIEQITVGITGQPQAQKCLFGGQPGSAGGTDGCRLVYLADPIVLAVRLRGRARTGRFRSHCRRHLRVLTG